MTERADRWRRLKEILADVLETPPARRAALIAQRCGDDHALRAELEALVDGEEASHILDKPLPFLAGEDVASPLSDGESDSTGGDPLIGTNVGGRYRLERSIGQGGMGRVYEAVQDDGELTRKVAVKLIRKGLGSEQLIQRFRRERQALAVQTHPNIARLYDVGATEDGLPYLVMERIDGVPIDRYCDERALTVKQRLALFRKVCAAVSSAHRNLIIHRDLKPSNILVTAEGEPKLLDFGVAKPLEQALAGEQEPLTTPAARFFTPEYASPEQVLGQPVTTAADIYSLGVLLHGLLTGRLPFRPEKPSSPLVWERIAAKTQPDKPSAVALRDDGQRERAAKNRGVSPQKLSRTLRGELDNIVSMAMRKEPERRYGAVEQLGEDIDRYLRGLPVTAQADTWGYRVRKFIGRNRASVGAAAIVLLSLIGAVIGVSRQARRAQAEAEKARTVVDFLKEMVASPNPYQGEGKDVTVAETLDQAAATIEPRFGDKPEIAAELRTAIGVTYYSLGLYDAAKTQLTQALDLLTAIHDPPHVELAAALRELGVTHQYQGDYEQAADFLGRSVAMFDALGAEGPSYANALNEYAMVWEERGDHEAAGRYYARARDVFRRVYGPDHEDVAALTGNLAVNAHYRGDLDQAESLYRETLDLLQKRYGENHLDRATTFGNLAQVLVERNDLETAESLLRQSLAIKRELLGDGHAAVGLDYHNLGGVSYMRKAFEPAVDYFDQALAVYGQAYPEDHPRIGQTHMFKGNAYIALQRHQEAESSMRRAMAIFEKSLPAGHHLIAFCQDGLGASLIGLGRYQEAETALLAGFAALQDDPALKRKFQTNISNLARLYEAWARSEEAAKYRAMLPPEETAAPSQQ